jgi:hypothetical protein
MAVLALADGEISAQQTIEMAAARVAADAGAMRTTVAPAGLEARNLVRSGRLAAVLLTCRV